MVGIFVVKSVKQGLIAKISPKEIANKEGRVYCVECRPGLTHNPINPWPLTLFSHVVYFQQKLGLSFFFLQSMKNKGNSKSINTKPKEKPLLALDI